MAWTPKGEPRKNKYDAQPTVYFFTRYDSKAEAEYANDLDILLLAGAVRRWTRQAKIVLSEDGLITTRIDFVVDDVQDGIHGVEIKGQETAQFKLIKRAWPLYGPFPLVILKRKGTGWSREVIQGKADNG